MSFNIIDKSTTELTYQDDIQIIPEYLRIKKLITEKHPLIFVTGGAGTGKSTLIKWLIEEFKGKVLLGAPTAIAALNIGAKTLHSLCVLPPAWVMPHDIKHLTYRKDIRKARILIIDEISMVNPNLLDGIDSFFQLNRKSDKPFGGLITIMVGDLFQLPPVVNNNLRKVFKEYYESYRFYSANCIKENNMCSIHLNKIFRQKDDTFIDVLLNIREGNNIQDALNIINSKCKIVNNPKGHVVRICPTNRQVQHYNDIELQKIDSPETTYTGEIKGTFKPDNLPSPMLLSLKVGAQVMFNQNDPDKKWINGTVGVVTELLDKHVKVKLIYDPLQTEVDVHRTVWSDFKYSWNEKTRELQRVEIGSYSQLPLMLAWASTIHKTQGKTIDRIHLDLGSGAFETGQTYVALSRCPTMEGISLSRAIDEDDILVDYQIKEFYDNIF